MQTLCRRRDGSGSFSLLRSGLLVVGKDDGAGPQVLRKASRWLLGWLGNAGVAFLQAHSGIC